MAQPFDEQKLEVTGDAVPVADPAQEEDSILRSSFSVSANGLLVYAEGTTGTGRELVWFDRTGKRVGDLPGAEAYRTPRVSPDGKRIAYTSVRNGKYAFFAKTADGSGEGGRSESAV